MNSCNGEHLFLSTQAKIDGAPLNSQVMGNPVWLDDAMAEVATTQGHPAALSLAYQQWGEQCTRYLSGDFALLLHDPGNGTAFAATDRLGRYPLYYRVGQGLIQISTDIGRLQTDSAAALTPQGLYNYMFFHMIPAPGTFAGELRKLGMAEQLVWKDSGVSTRRYWLPRFDQDRTEPAESLSAQLRHTLRSAVSQRIGNPETTGAFLSGGLDSSTVVGMLADCLGSEAQAFAIGFDAPGYDEMPFARITARHFGVKLHEYYVTPTDIVDALPSLVASCGEPFGNSSMLPAFFCARMAHEQGIRHLLAGDGGDELFAGNERYAKQAIFEHYGKVPSLLRKALLEPVINHLPKAIPLVGKARSYIAQANVPLPDRLHTYNFLSRHEPEEFFSAGTLSQVDRNEPLRLLGEVYQAPVNASTLDRLLYLDWQFAMADNDLRKVRQACDYVGVDVSFPMLDDQLVELSLKVPDALKLKGSQLRHFYKESLRGWLPDATIMKSKQGFGLPFGVWMQTHQPLKELALDNLVALRQRGWFNAGFIDHAIELHRTGHASYYGELIWILMVLELWLQAREKEGRLVASSAT